MLQITDAATEQRRWPLLRLAFRPFFLFGALFAVAAITRWIGIYSGYVVWTAPTLSPVMWHAHEMVFGFVMAIIAGFLLTAVQNWTGVPGVRGWPLVLLIVCWMVGRITWWAALETGWRFLPDALFIGLTIAFLAYAVLSVRQWHNLVFVPVLLAFGTLHGVMALYAQTDPLFARGASLASVWLVVLVISIVGGRVIPFFTARRWNTAKVQETTLELALANVPMVLIAGLAITDGLHHWDARILLLLAAMVHGRRAWRWHHPRNYQEPLLWSLHLAYAALPLSLALMSLDIARISALALHLLAVGLISTMIIAMMARVALGHTGRALIVARTMPIAFIAMLIAAVFRALLPMAWPQLTLIGITSGGSAFALALLLFVRHYWRILSQPRADGRPG